MFPHPLNRVTEEAAKNSPLTNQEKNLVYQPQEKMPKTFFNDGLLSNAEGKKNVKFHWSQVYI